MKVYAFHSAGHKGEIDSDWKSYQKELIKTYGSSFLMSIWITLLISGRKTILNNRNIKDASKLY
jgi:hypothetical protein